MNLRLVLLCICGLLLHFLMRWWEAWRTTGPINPGAYALQDLPIWLAAIVGTVSVMLMLRSFLVLLGIEADAAPARVESMMQLAAFCAGYMGSSIATKVPALFGKRTGLDQIDEQKP
jgi:hypothetical protein